MALIEISPVVKPTVTGINPSHLLQIIDTASMAKAGDIMSIAVKSKGIHTIVDVEIHSFNKRVYRVRIEAISGEVISIVSIK
ncbi:hypothetical protein EON83_01445 [bacterium]|nr:MAG: hypothetical protein EON83_01445 [bacterium]